MSTPGNWRSGLPKDSPWKDNKVHTEAIMRIMEVFSFAKPGFNPDPHRIHDRDKARGWWGFDEKGRRHFWHWDYRNNRWY